MGQFSLFGGDVSGVEEVVVPIPDTEWDKKTRLAFEKEMLGLYVSDHPLLGVERALQAMCTSTIPGLWDQEDKSSVTVGGLVGPITRRYTKAGDPMYFFSFEDLQGSTEVVCFPRTVAEYGPLVREDALLIISGRVDNRGDEVKVIAQEIREPALEEGDMVRLQVAASRLSPNLVHRIRAALQNHPGTAPVYLHMRADGSEKVVRLGDEHRVEPRSALYAELRELLGASAVL
jgi:DNA polymerase-3 subunit alpha